MSGFLWKDEWLFRTLYGPVDTRIKLLLVAFRYLGMNANANMQTWLDKDN